MVLRPMFRISPDRTKNDANSTRAFGGTNLPLSPWAVNGVPATRTIKFLSPPLHCWPGPPMTKWGRDELTRSDGSVLPGFGGNVARCAQAGGIPQRSQAGRLTRNRFSRRCRAKTPWQESPPLPPVHSLDVRQPFPCLSARHLPNVSGWRFVWPPTPPQHSTPGPLAAR